MAITHATTREEFNGILFDKFGKLIVVDFFATWCGPCRAIAPAFESLARENPDVIFIKVDVDKVPEVAGEHGIRGMPTFLFFRDGAKVGEVVGADLRSLAAKIAELTG